MLFYMDECEREYRIPGPHVDAAPVPRASKGSSLAPCRRGANDRRESL